MTINFVYVVNIELEIGFFCRLCSNILAIFLYLCRDPVHIPLHSCYLIFQVWKEYAQPESAHMDSRMITALCSDYFLSAIFGLQDAFFPSLPDNLYDWRQAKVSLQYL